MVKTASADFMGKHSCKTDKGWRQPPGHINGSRPGHINGSRPGAGCRGGVGM